MSKFLISLLVSILLPEAANSFELFNKEVKCGKKNYSLEKVYNHAKKGVVVISTPTGTGSGFVVKQSSNKTYILTNSHVVDNNLLVAPRNLKELVI